MEEIEFFLDDAKDTMEGALKHLAIELSKIRAGKAAPSMVEGIMVDYYGMPTPITGTASITAPDSRTIALKPFDKKMIGEIERAIRNSNIGLSPNNDGEYIRLNIPMLTEERRKELVKRVKAEIEVAKVNVRNIRQDANNAIKKLKADGVSEDDIKTGEEKNQVLTNTFIARIETVLADKEKDIMSV
jgi:ribosome recycling factor